MEILKKLDNFADEWQNYRVLYPQVSSLSKVTNRLLGSAQCQSVTLRYVL